MQYGAALDHDGYGGLTFNLIPEDHVEGPAAIPMVVPL